MNEILIKNRAAWVCNEHKHVNHLYDVYLPYRYHLERTVSFAREYLHLLPERMYIEPADYRSEETDITHETVILAAWGHDLLEDTRLTYNDVRRNLGNESTEIVYALTNEKGRSRKERANDKYYEGLRNTKGAVFVKICDRLANLEYSKMTNGSMLQQYKDEHRLFCVFLDRKGDYAYLEEMFKRMDDILGI